MKPSNKIAPQKPWAKAITRPAKEFPLTPLPIVQGTIPESLRGTLYRNGPARLERGQETVGHWFDGDGAILAIHFSNSSASSLYRYVKTAGYQAEAQANRYLFSNYGMTAPGPRWLRWTKGIKNVANTSVLALPDKLLALWEGGQPYALDLDTLDTKGMDRLGGLKHNLNYSAHCKRDPKTGQIFNFGVTAGYKGKLNLYKSDPTGQIIQKNTLPLPGISLVHDFVLAGPYLIFFLPPLRLKVWPVLTGLKSFGDAFEWRPELGTHVLIIDRETLSLISQSETDPWYQWHFGNGYVDEKGVVVVEFVRFQDFATNQRLKEVAAGQTTTDAEGLLWRVRLEPQTGRVLTSEQLCDQPCEFPKVLDSEVGQPSRYTYLATYRPGTERVPERYNALARFDSQTGTYTRADLGENCYPTEPICIPDAHNPEKIWLLTVVYEGNVDRSEVWIFEGAGLDREPVCRLALPSVVPLSFHGTWRPKEGRG